LFSVYDSVVVMAPYNNGPLHVESDAEAIQALSQYPAGQSDQISNAASGRLDALMQTYPDDQQFLEQAGQQLEGDIRGITSSMTGNIEGVAQDVGQVMLIAGGEKRLADFMGDIVTQIVALFSDPTTTATVA